MGTRRRSDIFRAADMFRDALRRSENSALTRLALAYQKAGARLDEIARALPEAEMDARAMAFAQMRLRLLGEQIGREIDGLVMRGAVIAGDGQREAAGLAVTHAEELVRLAAARLEISWAHLPVEAVEQMLGQTRPGSPLFDLLASLGAEVHQQVEREMVTGIALGINPRDVALRMIDKLRLSYSRAETIARTEMLRAYREVTRQSYAANPHVVRGWIWYSALDTRTCPSCWAMHGTRHTLDEVLDDHPNGRCAMLPVVDGMQPVPEGATLFALLPRDEQVAILGGKALEAYEAGQVTLSDFVGRRSHPRWGTMRYARSLRSAMGV